MWPGFLLGIRLWGFGLLGLAGLMAPAKAQDNAARTRLGDGLVAVDTRARGVGDTRFDELMEEAHLIFVDAVVADKSLDTLEAAFYFDLLFEAMSDIEQLPLFDELQRLEFNRFINATISYYENDSQTLERVETSLTVSALRDELGRYTRAFPTDLGNTRVDYKGEGHLPITYNNQVGRLIEFFQTRGNRVMQVWLNRLPRYRLIMEPILEREGLPPELIFVAMVESGFNPRAYSWAHASGPWQFISSTGRLYGLTRDWWRDERQDFEKATVAAARHMKRLYAEFDDWYLVMAAYNTGEGRVRRAMRIQRTDDFWKLSILPRETRNHIPKIMAAFLIAQDPEKYGFTVNNSEEPLVWDVVPVDRSLTFETLGQIAECNPDTFRLFNPELRQQATPPPEGDQPYLFKIPRGHKAAFERNYQAIASQVGPVLAGPQIIRHRVRRGESLYSISRRYGVPMGRIASANRLKNWHKLRLGQRLEIPLTPSAVAARQPLIPSNPNAKKIQYTVRIGDTLGEIAESYNVGLSRVRSWNGIRPGSDNLRVGQKLVIWTATTQPVPRRLSRASVVVPPGMEKRLYTVRAGDTLSQIAEAHEVGLSRLLSWNGLRSTSNIRVGQKLVILTPKG